MKGSRLQKEARFGSPHLLKGRGQGCGAPARSKAPSALPFTIGVASYGLTTPQIERSLEKTDEEARWLDVALLFSWLSDRGGRARQLMARPTVGELKRVLALDELAALRAEIKCRAEKTQEFVGQDSVLGVRLEALRNLSRDDQVIEWGLSSKDEPFSAAWFAAHHAVLLVAAPIWLSELAQAGVAEKLAARAADLDAGLPPPAPATPSTRGRL